MDLPSVAGAVTWQIQLKITLFFFFIFFFGGGEGGGKYLLWVFSLPGPWPNLTIRRRKALKVCRCSFFVLCVFIGVHLLLGRCIDVSVVFPWFKFSVHFPVSLLQSCCEFHCNCAPCCSRGVYQGDDIKKIIYGFLKYYELIFW